MDIPVVVHFFWFSGGAQNREHRTRDGQFVTERKRGNVANEPVM